MLQSSADPTDRTVTARRQAFSRLTLAFGDPHDADARILGPPPDIMAPFPMPSENRTCGRLDDTRLRDTGQRLSQRTCCIELTPPRDAVLWIQGICRRRSDAIDDEDGVST